MEKYKLLGGHSKKLDRYYDLTVEVKDDGSIVLHEDYEYPARGDDEGREYSYKLIVPAESVETFIARLRAEDQESGSTEPSSKNEALISHLRNLVRQGRLAGVEEARAKQNFELLKGWLDKDGIEYKQDVWSWIS